MKGRPRIPKGQKVLQGTFRKDRNPAQEPEPSRLNRIPSPPSSLNAFGKKFWKQYMQELSSIGVMTEVDLSGFEIVAQTYGQWKEAEQAIYHPIYGGKKTKRTLAEYMRDREHSRKNMGELMTLEKARNDFFRFAAQFGMTPAFRNKIDIKEAHQEQKDPMENLLDG
ncbi:MAG: P27 family phage terminase small subunit [Sphaerochaetaceae bacterium]